MPKLQLTFRIRPDFLLSTRNGSCPATTKHGRAELGSSLEEALVNAIEVGILDAPVSPNPTRTNCRWAAASSRWTT